VRSVLAEERIARKLISRSAAAGALTPGPSPDPPTRTARRGERSVFVVDLAKGG
jgi:hypothetical protein